MGQDLCDYRHPAGLQVSLRQTFSSPPANPLRFRHSRQSSRRRFLELQPANQMEDRPEQADRGRRFDGHGLGRGNCRHHRKCDSRVSAPSWKMAALVQPTICRQTGYSLRPCNCQNRIGAPFFASLCKICGYRWLGVMVIRGFRP